MSKKPSTSDRNVPEDFWDLGDDDLMSNSPENEATENPVEDLAAPPSEEAATPPEAEEVLREAFPVEESVSIDPAPPEPAPVKKPRTPLSLVEKLSLLILIATLIGAAGWAIVSSSKEAPQGPLITFDEDFPIKGDEITVASVETWWRKPVRTGDNADRGVVIAANLIPCARIELTDSGSTTLLVTFQNGDQDLVGDPITLIVENGKFVQSGQSDITIHSTSGFESTSELNAYTNGDLAPWAVVIEESSLQPNDEDPLAKVRIDASYQE